MQQLLTKKCRACNESFEATRNNQLYCKPCADARRKEKMRMYHKKWVNKGGLERHLIRQKNSGKTPVTKGTFGDTYLEVNSEGRVNGALWLEKKRDFNGSGKLRGIKPPRDLSLFSKFDLLSVRNKIYCGECWSPFPLIIAPSNEYYSMMYEACCGNCGLVIDREKLWVG